MTFFPQQGYQGYGSPESIARKRRLAEQLMQGVARTPRNVGEGLSALGNALAVRGINSRADEAEKAGREDWEKQFGWMLGSMEGDQGPQYSTTDVVAALSHPYAPKGFQQASPALMQALQGPEDEKTSAIRNYEYGLQNPAFAESLLARAKAGASSVRVGGGTTYDIGSIPPGYRVVYENNVPVAMEPVEGGPAARDVAAEEAAATKRKEATAKTAGIQVEEIGRAKSLIEKSPTLTTGFFGDILRNFGGTGARDLEGLIDTIKANIGFDRLNQMRAQSPTGGALGQVTERELKFLQSVAGSLDQSQSAEQLVQNLERLELEFGRVVNGPDWTPPERETKQRRRRYDPATGSLN